ncbi:uncharacterized protein LOC135107540 [Scylla paramamosain]|uniref:uncharacterized protein LOC135107540 n=1 Tax=Scylla paramamosain TaxID=85552 RepID=UPI003082D6DD
MKFWVMLIPNPLYTNDSALVTVGAQYDNENYVYVGTDKLIYNMLEEVYTPKNTLLTQSATIAQYSGATFVLDSYLYHPFADVFFQVSIPSSTSYDAFSISSIGIAFMGSNFGCSGASRTTYYPSITNLTNYMGEYFIHLRTSGLTYPLNSADYHDNANFQIQFFFNVYAMHAAVGSTVDVDVGLVMGITSVFTDTVTLTVTAGVSPPVAFGEGSWSSASAITPTTVEEGQVVTWAATFTMDSGANVEVTCTLTDNGGNKVCGIGYGKVGANIAVLPALSQYLEFTADNSVTFTLFFNSTGEVANSSANAVEFEFSVIAGVSSTAISISCPTAGTPLAETLSATATAPSGGGSDVKVWMEFITPLNDVWYEGSQMGLLLKLSFPAGGTPYTNLVVEGIGDVEKTAWGARTCGARLISAGKGVPCLTGHQFAINTGVELIDSLLGRPFVDTSKIVLGPACGTERTIDTADTDYEAAVELYFDMPQGQSGFLGGSYNLSLGVNLDNQVIWTGWDITQLEAGPPTADTSAILHYGFLSDSVPASDIEPGVPQFIQVLLRLKPESVMLYKITAAVSNTDILNLCRIMVIQAGDNFPCLDKNPYDNKDELYPTISVTHDTDWGLSATLDLGVLKNLGNNTFLSGIIADENAIVVGVMVKGVLAGTDTLTVILDSSGTTSVLTQELTVGSAITPNLALISVTPVPVDGTSNAYEGVMKMVDFVVEVPEGYKNTLKAIITNTAVTDMTVCFGAVVAVGQNLPCVIASKILGNMTEVTPTSEVYEVDMKEVCHYPFSENQTENQFTLRIGVMFIPSSGDTATLSLVIQEGGSDLAPVTFQLTKLSEAFSGEANETGMQLEPLIDVDTVTPRDAVLDWCEPYGAQRHHLHC